MKTLLGGCAVYVNDAKTKQRKSAPRQTSLNALLEYVAIALPLAPLPKRRLSSFKWRSGGVRAMPPDAQNW